MNQWAFVIAAYAVTLLGLAGLVAWAWLSCREAEDQAERLGRRP
jgi:heme exporter protein CcmD